VSTVQFRPCPFPTFSAISNLRLLGGNGVGEEGGDCPDFVPIFSRQARHTAGGFAQVFFTHDKVSRSATNCSYAKNPVRRLFSVRLGMYGTLGSFSACTARLTICLSAASSRLI